MGRRTTNEESLEIYRKRVDFGSDEVTYDNTTDGCKD